MTIEIIATNKYTVATFASNLQKIIYFIQLKYDKTGSIFV